MSGVHIRSHVLKAEKFLSSTGIFQDPQTTEWTKFLRILHLWRTQIKTLVIRILSGEGLASPLGSPFWSWIHVRGEGRVKRAWTLQILWLLKAFSCGDRVLWALLEDPVPLVRTLQQLFSRFWLGIMTLHFMTNLLLHESFP